MYKKIKPMLTIITGGARSGKSRHAQTLAREISEHPVYIATAEIRKDDAEFTARIDRHKQDRGPEWQTYEAARDLHQLPLSGKTVLVDCVTLWLSRIFTDCNQNADHSLSCFKDEFEKLIRIEDARFFVITNEIGMGVHAHTESARAFTDLQGWVNQHIAGLADEVICMISGIPLTLKPKP